MIKPVGLTSELRGKILETPHLTAGRLLREENYDALKTIILDPSFDKLSEHFRESVVSELAKAFRNKKDPDIIETFLEYLQESNLDDSQRKSRLDLVSAAITNVKVPDNDRKRVASVLQKVFNDIKMNSELIQAEIELIGG